jgi:phage tail sheath protein FI
MPSTYTYPGVYIQELPSPVHPITGVATSVAAFVGYTATGIDNRAELIFSFSDYERLFGGLASDSEVSYAVQQFFQNGGNQAYVVRTPALSLGAKPATVVFAGLTFSALSSGAWANGQLLIDVDTKGLSRALPGLTVVLQPGTVNAAIVTGQGFTTTLKKDQWLVFTADPTPTPYQIASVDSDTQLTLESPGYGGAATSSGTVEIDDPVAFNLTVTNLVDGAVESFPDVTLNSNFMNYVVSVVNDPDNGSQLVNITNTGALSTTAPPTVTGVVGNPLVVATVDSAIAGSTPLTGGVGLTGGSNAVTGSGGVDFQTDLKVGQLITFAADASQTLYQVNVITDATHLTLFSKYAGTTSGTPVSTNATIVKTTVPAGGNDFGISLSVSSPSPSPSPLPVDVKVFAKNTPLPQTIPGVAAQLQSAINAVLRVQMPGASVECSVAGIPGSQAIRINAKIPQTPDAVITIRTPSPASGFSDASSDLGFPNPPTGVSSNVAHYALGTGNSAWGQETSSGLGADGTGLPETGDLIGDPSRFTGIYALDKIDAFNLLCIPEATRAMPGNPAVLDITVDPNAIYSTAIAYCDAKRAFLLLDCPPYVNTTSAAIDWKTTGLTVSDPNGAAFYPRLRLPDPLNNYQLRTFAPCGVVAGLYARIDSSRGVWKAPAGIEATLSGVQSLIYKMTDAENGVLNPLGLNCFRTFPVYGSVLWGARTLVGADAETSQWKYVPVRRVALFIESSLYQGTQWVVFEPNDEPLWSAIRLNVGSFMQNLFIQGYFQGQTPDQAYFVKCDSETTTQTDIDNGVVNIVVGFAPLEPAEFVVIQIKQISGQTSN